MDDEELEQYGESGCNLVTGVRFEMFRRTDDGSFEIHVTGIQGETAEAAEAAAYALLGKIEEMVLLG